MIRHTATNRKTDAFDGCFTATLLPLTLLLTRRSLMSDDKTKTGGPDRQRVNIHEDYELRDWAAKWGVSEQQVRDAVAKVGPMVADVERELKK
jgi:hypothetical protein